MHIGTIMVQDQASEVSGGGTNPPLSTPLKLPHSAEPSCQARFVAFWGEKSILGHKFQVF